MTVNGYLWAWAAAGFMVQLNSVIQLSPAARLPRSLSGEAEDVESLISVLNTDTQIYTVCLNGWGHGHPSLGSYRIFTWRFLRCIFSLWISCWCLSRMGKVEPRVLRAAGTSPLKSWPSADFLFPPLKCLGLRAPTRRWVAWSDSCSKPKAFDFGKVTSVLALPLWSLGLHDLWDEMSSFLSDRQDLCSVTGCDSRRCFVTS